MADKDLRIGIKVDADLAGAEATDAALKKVIADQEKLSNTGAGLATNPADVTAAREFVVTTQAEYEAIQKTIAALLRKIAVLSAAGESTAVYTAKLAALDKALSSESALAVAEQMESKAIAIKQAAEAATLAQEEERLSTRKSIETKRELRSALRVLGQQFGALRGLAYNIFNPVTLGIAGIGVAVRLFEEAQRKAEALRAALEDFQKPLNLSGMASQLGSVETALLKARDNADDFWQSLNQVASAEATIAANTAAAIQQLQLQAQEDNKVAEAKRNVARAEVQAKAESGVIGKEEEIRRLAELDAKADADTIRRNQKLRADELQAKRQQLKDLDAAIQAAEDRTHKAQSENEKELQGPVRRSVISNQLNRSIADYQSRVEKGQKLVDSFGKVGFWDTVTSLDPLALANATTRWLKGYDPTSPTETGTIKQLESDKATLAALAAQRKTIEAPAYQEKFDHAAEVANAEKNNAEAELKRLQEQRQKVAQAVKEDEAANVIQTTGENEAAKFNNQARDISTKARADEQARRDKEEADRKAEAERKEREREERERAKADDADVQKKYGKHSGNFSANFGSDELPEVPAPPTAALERYHGAVVAKFDDVDRRIDELTRSLQANNSRSRDYLNS